MSDEELIEIVETAAAKLGEHFCAVQILVSWQVDGGGTANVYRGTGNWYARRGMAHHFIEEDQAQDSADAIARVMPQPPPADDGDEWKK